MISHALTTPDGSRRRRDVLAGSVAALLLTATPATVPAKAAELDGELVALLNEGRAALAAWQATPFNPATTYAEHIGPKPWDAPLTAAAQLPAHTPEGLRAKAETAADWLAGGDRSCGLPHHCRNGEEQVAWSLLRDLLPELPAARPSPVPVLPVVAIANPDAELIALCRGHAALLNAANDQTASDAESEAATEAYGRSCDAICDAVPRTLPGMIAMARAVWAEARNLDGSRQLHGTVGEDWALTIVEALVRHGGGA